MAGLLDPDQGAVLLDGQAIEGPEKRLVPGYEEIRLVHQDFQLKFKMTVAENIRYELLAYIKEYQQERIELLLDLFKIKHLRDTDVSQLSGGERQRVAIARGLAHEPDVLLMDEPFSNLDLGTKSGLLSEIKHLARETNTAILLITHDTRDALEVGDWISVINKGKLIRNGAPQEIYTNPQLEAVANLFGSFNVIEKSNFKKFGIKSKADKVGVWPESIIVVEEGLEAKLINSIFMGHYWKLEVRISGQMFTVYSSEGSKVVKVKVDSYFELL